MPEFHQAKSHPSRDLSLLRCIRSARPWADPSAAGGYDLSRSPQVRPPTRIYWELVTTPNARPHPRESDLAGLGRGLGTCILYLHQDHLPHPYPKFLSSSTPGNPSLGQVSQGQMEPTPLAALIEFTTKVGGAGLTQRSMVGLGRSKTVSRDL